jgi:hypothetical protein
METELETRSKCMSKYLNIIILVFHFLGNPDSLLHSICSRGRRVTEGPSAANRLERGGIAMTELKGFVVKPEVGGDLGFHGVRPQEIPGVGAVAFASWVIVRSSSRFVS